MRLLRWKLFSLYQRLSILYCIYDITKMKIQKVNQKFSGIIVANFAWIDYQFYLLATMQLMLSVDKFLKFEFCFHSQQVFLTVLVHVNVVRWTLAMDYPGLQVRFTKLPSYLMELLREEEEICLAFNKVSY